ncbi:hypothetical protein RQP46_009826 [Phenoliferia psychrophenolica]
MPSQIHVELIEAKKIPDPFKKLHEQDVQWVGEEDWVYKTEFETPKEKMEHVDLVFEGLDTFAIVFLNGVKILSSENMFRAYRVAVVPHLCPVGSTNTLEIVFQSAFITGKIIEEEHLGKDKHYALWNGDASRMWVRKAGYNYGWDWGPVLMTAGPYRPIHLESYNARLTSFWPRITLSPTLAATLSLESTTSLIPTPTTVHYKLHSPSGVELRKASILSSSTEATTWEIPADEIELWWSVGLGKQPLYTVEAQLVGASGEVLDMQTKKVGFRRLRVVQEPLEGQEGTSFYFEVNNVPIFCGGSNWIPMDSFLTNCTEDRYRQWLELLVAGGQNMIRSWAGGVYEVDSFFELCDELGILVWQDFAFGCGQYPAHPSFVANVKAEAEDNVERIRHHASLAILAGNNEDYQVAESCGLEYNPKDHTGSPWGGKDTRDPTVGDIHQWNVWHGTQEPYQNWDKLGGRFISEFGMQGYPDVKTIDYWLDGDKSERFPQSKKVGYHNKDLIENIRHSFDLEGYVYATQFIQAETLSTAYRLWRREFKGPGKAGALVWQLNDVYPCTSWAIVDYFLRPKPAYYTIKQSLSPIAVGMKRYTTRTYPKAHSLATFTEKHTVETWAANARLESRDVVVVTEAFELRTGKRIFIKEVHATLGENRSTELDRIDVPDSADALAVCVKLRDPQTGETISRFSTYPEPYKFLQFPTEKVLKLEVERVGAEQLKISAACPVKGLILHFSDDVKLSDNCLDLIPGDERIIEVGGLKKETVVTWQYLK